MTPARFRPPAPPRRRPALALVVACLALAACATPAPTRFHTLMAPPLGEPVLAASAPVARSSSPAWELLPVAIPAQVDRPQMVVQLGDGSLAVVEQERWIAPLADELQAALAERLTDTLGVPEASPRSPRGRWRVRIAVQRFDSVLARRVRLDADWRLSSSEEPRRALRCRSRHEQLVQPGYAALAAGHREAAVALADAIAERLRVLEAGQQPLCPGPPSA